MNERIAVNSQIHLPATQHAAHDELKQVLSTYTEGELNQAFVVIEPGGHRTGRFPRK